MTRGAMARGAALLLLLGMAAATHEYCSPGAFALNVSRTHPSTVRTRASLACPTLWRGGRGSVPLCAGGVPACVAPHRASPSVFEMVVALTGRRGLSCLLCAPLARHLRPHPPLLTLAPGPETGGSRWPGRLQFRTAHTRAQLLLAR